MSVSRSASRDARRASRAWRRHRSRGDLAGQRLEALDACERRTELVVIHDVRELRHALGERLLLVLLEEELRIGEARAHDALVAFDDLARRLRLDVRHDQEARAQLAGDVGQREILLVGLHREDQAFLRDLQEFVLEAARVDDRPFDQRRHFVEQRLGHHDGIAVRVLVQLRADRSRRSAKCAITRPVAQRVGVAARMLDRDEAVGQEAVAERGVAGVDAECGDGHDAIVAAPSGGAPGARTSRRSRPGAGRSSPSGSAASRAFRRARPAGRRRASRRLPNS